MLWAFLALCCWALDPSYNPEGWDPVASSDAVEMDKDNKYRFTVLADGLIRLEYDENGVFEDRPSTVFVNRKQPTPSFKTSKTNGNVVIETSKMTLSYKVGSGKFTKDTLQIAVKGGETWTPGTQNTGLLPGTIRTLDQIHLVSLNCTDNANVQIHGEQLYCAWGLMSRNGWTLLDDTSSAMYTSDFKWLDLSGVGDHAVNTPNGNDQDWYFFAYGSDYKQVMQDFTNVAGKIPLVPRYMLGILFSRWWGFDQNSVKVFIKNWESQDVPLDVFILDMNWHYAKDDSPNSPWGGYSWNKKIFPYPEDMQEWLHNQGLRVAANIHDTDGVGTYNDLWDEFAKSLSYFADGYSSKHDVPFNGTSFEYMTKLDDVVMRPIMQNDQSSGFDLWWLDWQQGDQVRVKTTTNPTSLTARVRVRDHSRRGENVRGTTLSRFGGLGEHRHQVGFSGDVNFGGGKVWEALAFQPYFSASAANVGYGYWSHDIVGEGGNYGPVSPDSWHPPTGETPDKNELETRFIQWGAFSPIMRMHDRGGGQGGCAKADRDTCDPIDLTRHPWQNFQIEREVIQERVRLIPYLYTAARAAYDTGVSPLHPLYYEHPKVDNAYVYLNQYMFGPDMMVAPVVNASNSTTLLTEFPIWMPPGEWYEELTGLTISGSVSKMLERSFDISEVPRFYRTGTAVPTLIPEQNLGWKMGLAQQEFSTIQWRVFLGSQSSATGELYNDDGFTMDFMNDVFERTTFTVAVSDDRKTITGSLSTTGNYPSNPGITFSTKLFGITVPPNSVSCGDEEMKFAGSPGAVGTWFYDGFNMALVVECANGLKVTFPSALSPAKNGYVGAMRRARLIADVSTSAGHWIQSSHNLAPICVMGDTLAHFAGLGDADSFAATLANATTWWAGVMGDVEKNGALKIPDARGYYMTELHATAPGLESTGEVLKAPPANTGMNLVEGDWVLVE